MPISSETSLFRELISAASGGANIQNLNQGILGRSIVPFPPLPTQHKIASILSAYDDLIENNLQRIKLLEELAQRTYEEWFVKFRVNGVDLEVDAGTGLPAGWERMKIGECCNASGGGTPSRNSDEFWNNGMIPWFSPTDLSKSKSLVQLDSSDHITELGLKKSSAKLMQPNSFMMTSRATIGLFGLMNKPFCTNEGFINVTPLELFHKEFLLYNFISRVDEFKGQATGTTFLELSKAKFKTLEIIWPNEEILLGFHSLVNRLHCQMENLTEQNRLLKESRDILLPRLMSGEVEVCK